MQIRDTILRRSLLLITMKLKFSLLLLLVLPVLISKAQVKTITYAQMEERVMNTDTVYIVNFWATWCGPCVSELPYFDKLQQTYKGSPLKVLLVSMDFQSKLKSAVIPFVKNHKMKTDVYFAERKDDQEFINDVDKDWSGALPATLVVNTKKGIRKFYEKTFTYQELNDIYQTNK